MTSLPRRRASIFSPIVLWALRFHTRFTGQQRARVLVRDTDDNVLLIWERIGTNRWALPGGGIQRNEMPIHAATRELHEETGVQVASSDLQFVGFFGDSMTKAGYDAHVFTTVIDRKNPLARGYNQLEIMDMRWFPAERLPSPLSPFVRLSLERLPKTLKI